jgi:hypothetical protein
MIIRGKPKPGIVSRLLGCGTAGGSASFVGEWSHDLFHGDSIDKGGCGARATRRSLQVGLATLYAMKNPVSRHKQLQK